MQSQARNCNDKVYHTGMNIQWQSYSLQMQQLPLTADFVNTNLQRKFSFDFVNININAEIHIHTAIITVTVLSPSKNNVSQCL